MSFRKRMNYYHRIFAAYLTDRKSHLTFWHGIPEVNPNFVPGQVGEYYMAFLVKADYPGQYDDRGIPLLDYQGAVGLQYNPIAIAQYGLGNYNLYKRTGSAERKEKFIKVAEWLVRNLEQNAQGQWVWNHHFDWEYRTPLKAPWYSALAQGQGLSVLVRAHRETGDARYAEAAEKAYASFLKTPAEGGVTHIDAKGDKWFEETIVDPPTHILNGFLWASWGIYDYALHTGRADVQQLFKDAVKTIRDNLNIFDTGYWSLYEQSGTRMKMLASPFYHNLHIVQLRIMALLTGDPILEATANRWESYRQDPLKKTRAVAYKSVFKLLYY